MTDAAICAGSGWARTHAFSGSSGPPRSLVSRMGVSRNALMAATRDCATCGGVGGRGCQKRDKTMVTPPLGGWEGKGRSGA